MVRQHQLTAAVAVTLAVTASLAPTASADPAPLAQAEAAIASTHNRASGTIRLYPDAPSQTGRATAPALAGSPAPCGDVCSSHGYPFMSAQPTTVRVTSGGGFNWGDAGIGAGACALLLGIGLAGTRAAAKGRKRHPAERRTIATS
jgi:hypothetical protein